MKRGREPAGWPHIREGTGARPENPGKGYFRGGFLYTARPSPACRRALHPAAPGERREKRRAASREPRATSCELRAASCEPRAASRELQDLCALAVGLSPIAVDFSQRTGVPAYDNGLQPHFPMWLKPREKWKPATRQLKQTAIKTETMSHVLRDLCDFAPLRLCVFARKRFFAPFPIVHRDKLRENSCNRKPVARSPKLVADFKN